jgi:hypothetical protein
MSNFSVPGSGKLVARSPESLNLVLKVSAVMKAYTFTMMSASPSAENTYFQLDEKALTTYLNSSDNGTISSKCSELKNGLR